MSRRPSYRFFILFMIAVLFSGCSTPGPVKEQTPTPSLTPQPTVNLTQATQTPSPGPTRTPVDIPMPTLTPTPPASKTVAPTLTPAFTAAPGAWTGVVPAYKYLSGRSNPSAVWTGKEMIIWGGTNGIYPVEGNGALYNPATDTWRVMSTKGAPSPRIDESVVWTGSRMIIWGGEDNNGALGDGARYNPVGNDWAAISSLGAPSPRSSTAVWTGKEMIVWGGNNFQDNSGTGARYDPSNDTWKPMSTLGAPSPRWGNTAIWTGSELIVWGGYGVLRGSPDDTPTPTKSPGDCTCASTSGLNDGARYNPTTDTWMPISTKGAPSPRYWFTAIWTGKEMIVWGGRADRGDYLNTGGRYDPATDTWTPVSLAGAPAARIWYSAVWTGKEMIVWGGESGSGASDSRTVNNGARYDPATDTWTALPDSGAPCPSSNNAAVWTGSEMIIWGDDTWDKLENCLNFSLGVGARYTPPD